VDVKALKTYYEPAKPFCLKKIWQRGLKQGQTMIFSILTMFWARNYNNQTDEQYYDT